MRDENGRQASKRADNRWPTVELLLALLLLHAAGTCPRRVPRALFNNENLISHPLSLSHTFHPQRMPEDVFGIVVDC